MKNKTLVCAGCKQQVTDGLAYITKKGKVTLHANPYCAIRYLDPEVVELWEPIVQSEIRNIS